MAGCCDRHVRRVQRVVQGCVQAGAAEGGGGRAVSWVVNWARVLVWGSAIGRAGTGRGGEGGRWLRGWGVVCGGGRLVCRGEEVGTRRGRYFDAYSRDMTGVPIRKWSTVGCAAPHLSFARSVSLL